MSSLLSRIASLLSATDESLLALSGYLVFLSQREGTLEHKVNGWSGRAGAQYRCCTRILWERGSKAQRPSSRFSIVILSITKCCPNTSNRKSVNTMTNLAVMERGDGAHFQTCQIHVKPSICHQSQNTLPSLLSSMSVQYWLFF